MNSMPNDVTQLVGSWLTLKVIN